MMMMPLPNSSEDEPCGEAPCAVHINGPINIRDRPACPEGDNKNDADEQIFLLRLEPSGAV